MHGGTCTCKAQLLVANAVHVKAAGIMMHVQGLQKVEKDTHKISLLTGRGPEPDGNITDIAYANDLDIAPDGTIYFTDSQWFGPTMGSGGFYDTLTACILGILQACPKTRGTAAVQGLRMLRRPSRLCSA